MASYITEYLVGLGFAIDQPQLAKFQGALKQAEGTVTGATGGMVADVLKFQFAATGAFLAVGGGVLGYIDKLAMSDQQMRLFAQRSAMTLQQARTIKTSLDILGVSIEDVSWDKELHGRFMTLVDDQQRLAKMLGPGYETQMKQVRDLQFQLQRLEVKGEYFGMKFASDLLAKLGIGDGTLESSLERLNDYVEKHIPEWSEVFSNDLVPALKETKTIALETWGVIKQGAGVFQELIGLLSGDESLQNTDVTFKSIGHSVEVGVHALSKFLQVMLSLEQVAGHDIKAGMLAAGGVKAWMLGDDDKGDAMLRAAGKEFNGGTAALQSLHDSNVGPGGGGVGLGLRRFLGAGSLEAPNEGGGGGGVAETARRMAKAVSEKTGIEAGLIYAQWAHETGRFTNRGTRELNNLAGIRLPGSTEYQSFASLDDFAAKDAQVLGLKRYSGLSDAHTGADYARVLKRGGYYKGPEDVYARQIDYFKRQYDGAEAGGATVGTINVHINNPGMSASEVQAAVKDGVRQGLGQQARKDMTRQAGPFPG